MVVLSTLGGHVAASQTTVDDVVPQHPLSAGTRVLLDAHNAYVENGEWSDRLDRALATGLPIAIEQDLVWVPPRRPRRVGRLSLMARQSADPSRLWRNTSSSASHRLST